MDVGEAGVSSPAIGESESGGRTEGSRLAQITVVGGFVGRDPVFRRILSLFFGRGDEKCARKNAKMYHSLRVDRFHRLRKGDTSFLRNNRKDQKVSSIPRGSYMYRTRVAEGEGDKGYGRDQLKLLQHLLRHLYTPMSRICLEA